MATATWLCTRLLNSCVKPARSSYHSAQRVIVCVTVIVSSTAHSPLRQLGFRHVILHLYPLRRYWAWRVVKHTGILHLPVHYCSSMSGTTSTSTVHFRILLLLVNTRAYCRLRLSSHVVQSVVSPLISWHPRLSQARLSLHAALLPTIISTVQKALHVVSRAARLAVDKHISLR